MASFKDKTGAAYLPTVDDDGAIPVVMDDEGTVQVDFESFLHELLIEIVALRLAVQETYNDGRDDQIDFREMAISIRDKEFNEG